MKLEYNIKSAPESISDKVIDIEARLKNKL